MESSNLTEPPSCKFLIVRLSSMGDIVLTTALIRCLRNKYRNSRIDFLVGYDFEEIIKFNPYIDNVYSYIQNNPEYNSELKNILPTDYKIIDLQNSRKSRKFIKGLGNEFVFFDKLHLKKLALVWFKKNLFPTSNIAERYITTANLFGVKNDNKGLEIWLKEELSAPVYAPSGIVLNSIAEQLHIAIAPASKHKTKQWLPEYFAELMDLLSLRYDIEFYLLGGHNDYDLCEYIASITATSTLVHNCSGKRSIFDTINILDGCSILITNDTGIMHIGAARMKPIVAIFGSTTQSLGFTPYMVEHKICEVNNLKCRPCSHYGKEKCYKRHFRCMVDVKPADVLEKFTELIGIINSKPIL